MPMTEGPRPEDDLDHALNDVLEYLALSAMEEGELDTLGTQMYRVITALLASQESQGQLSAYRESTLQRIRTMAQATGAAGPDSADKSA